MNKKAAFFNELVSLCIFALAIVMGTAGCDQSPSLTLGDANQGQTPGFSGSGGGLAGSGVSGSGGAGLAGVSGHSGVAGGMAGSGAAGAGEGGRGGVSGRAGSSGGVAGNNVAGSGGAGLAGVSGRAGNAGGISGSGVAGISGQSGVAGGIAGSPVGGVSGTGGVIGAADTGPTPTGGSLTASKGSSLWASGSVTTCSHGGPFAFPGAQGWGACAQGGRGRDVCYVTTTASDTDGTTPGSLQYCLNQENAGYVLFKVSGVINSEVSIVSPNKTIAGQTSPGGIILRSLICDNGAFAPRYRCHNVIVRHLRMRPGPGIDDGIRIEGGKNVIIDHASVQNANDESVQISRASYVTLQNVLLGEPIGEHVDLAGILLNYSNTSLPLDNISIHHTMWSRVGGRMPEMSCEDNIIASEFRDNVGALSDTNCAGHLNHVDLVSNLLWDQYAPIYYNECTGTNEGNPTDGSCTAHQSVQLNWISNASFARSSGSYVGETRDGLMDQFTSSTTANNRLYAIGNLLNGTAVETGITSAATPHASPAITVDAASTLIGYMTTNVGAFPRDTMDTRLLGYLNQSVGSTNRSWFRGSAMNDAAEGVAMGDAYAITPPTIGFPVDTDNDGMPDAWEILHRLNPAVADHNATTLSSSSGNGIAGCTTGYTNLECYLNELAYRRVQGTY